MRNYILDANGEPQATGDLMAWALWFETADRGLARTEVGASVVSTVFLGVDHDFRGNGPPILWETMVFTDGDGGDDQRRYTSKADALAGHAQLVADLERRYRVLSQPSPPEVP